MALRIEKYVNGAYGLAHDLQGRAHLVSNALPGELVEEKDSFEKGPVIISSCAEIIEKSDMRRSPRCSFYGLCGGCDFLIVDEKDSAFLKQEAVKDNLRRHAGMKKLPEFEVPVYGMFEGYRSRSRVHVEPKTGRVGFLGRSSNRLVPIPSCPALSGRLGRLLIEKEPLLKRAHSLMLEKGLNRNTGLVEVPLQEGRDGISMGKERVEALGYEVSAEVFFQSNLELLPYMLSFVHDNTVGKTVMDLYSGVGTFSKLFEGEGRTVYAVEKQKTCLHFSKRNAPSALSFTEDAASFSKRISTRMDTVIVDPPRVGLAKGVPGLIMKLLPERIIYVSCDSITASRDMASFLSCYDMVKACLFDFYPGSSHEETVFVLERKK